MCGPILYTDALDSCEYPLELCAAGYYVVVMLGERGDASVFGRSHYDFQDATLLFLAPDRAEIFASVAARCPAARMLAFDPTHFSCMGLDRAVCEYAFFHYDPAEMLHLATCEKCIVIQCMQDIAREAAYKGDCFSYRLLSQQILLLLDHCTRMYERQFITRDLANRPILSRYEMFVSGWIESGKLRTEGVPSVEVCAVAAGLSPACLCSLLRFEKGCEHPEYVQVRRIEIAERLLMKADRTIRQIAFLLGFSSVESFSRFFKRCTGCLPGAYRHVN